MTHSLNPITFTKSEIDSDTCMTSSLLLFSLVSVSSLVCECCRAYSNRILLVVLHESNGACQIWRLIETRNRFYAVIIYIIFSAHKTSVFVAGSNLCGETFQRQYSTPSPLRPIYRQRLRKPAFTLQLCVIHSPEATMLHMLRLRNRPNCVVCIQ